MMISKSKLVGGMYAEGVDNLLYYSDLAEGTLNVMSYSGSDKKVLVKNLEQPSALFLCPMTRCLLETGAKAGNACFKSVCLINSLKFQSLVDRVECVTCSFSEVISKFNIMSF